MKEIVKEVTRTEKITEYEAIDGTVFESCDECKKYDESARAVLMSKYKKLVIKTQNEYDTFFYCGCEDNEVDIIRIKTKEDADLLKQIYFFINPYKKKGELDGYTIMEFEAIDRALKENDVLFIGRGYDDESFWVYGSAATIIEFIANYRKLEKGSENG